MWIGWPGITSDKITKAERKDIEYDKPFWESYKRVNRLFSEVILDIAEEDDFIWIHDYHLN